MTKEQKLNMALAVKSGIKTSSHETITKAYQVAQKPPLFSGFRKTYAPKEEGAEVFPPESALVQYKVPDLIKSVEKELVPYYDVELTTDVANCSAKADLVVDGKVLATGLPATYFLFLEKHLIELKNFVMALPVLDPADEWKLDAEAGLFKTPVTQTAKSKKVQKPIVLYPHSPEHPGQAQLITEDVIVGHWETIKHSGAIKLSDKQDYVDRVEALIQAVQKGREAANAAAAPQQTIGKSIFDFVLGR